MLDCILFWVGWVLGRAAQCLKACICKVDPSNERLCGGSNSLLKMFEGFQTSRTPNHEKYLTAFGISQGRLILPLQNRAKIIAGQGSAVAMFTFSTCPTPSPIKRISQYMQSG